MVKLGQREKKEAKRGEMKKRKTKLDREKKLWQREREKRINFSFSIPSHLPPLEYKSYLNRLTTKT